MNVGRVCSLLALLLVSPLRGAQENDLKPNEQQKDVLQKAVKELLDFKRLPKPGEVMRPVSRTANAASKYMHKLFEQYKQNGHLGYAEGNIVRSISPVVGNVFGEETLSFKLNTIKPSEQVIRAELHYNIRHKRRSTMSKARKLISVSGVCEPASSCFGASSVPLQPMTLSNDWLSFDATEIVENALLSKSDHISVRFLRKSKPMECFELIRRNTPFLLIFSNDPSLIDKEKVQSALYSGNTQNEDEKSRMKRSVGYYTYSENGGEANDESRMHMHVEQFRSMGPKILQSRRQMRKSQLRKLKMQRTTPDPMMGFGMDSKSSDEEKEDTVQPRSKDDLSVILLGGAQHTEQKCGRRKLIVQFRDIGWEHWIIAPPSFEAHYCSGLCPFPLDKDVNPSNHAIVQSIIHTIGLNPYVPAVCCAPDKMDSLTLLYFDEMDNVVLKNYPKMIVSSCACL